MLKWVLIYALNGQYEYLDMYATEAECEKAAERIVKIGHDQKKHFLAGCYQNVSVSSWPGK